LEEKHPVLSSSNSASSNSPSQSPTLSPLSSSPLSSTHGSLDIPGGLVQRVRKASEDNITTALTNKTKLLHEAEASVDIVAKNIARRSSLAVMLDHFSSVVGIKNQVVEEEEDGETETETDASTFAEGDVVDDSEEEDEDDEELEEKEREKRRLRREDKKKGGRREEEKSRGRNKEERG
jgi:hypothetical protein